MINLTTLANGPVMEQATLSVGKVPWYIFWGSVLAPLLLAVLITMISVIVWRRVNRADKNPPLKSGKIVLWTIIIGVVYGSLFQWAMQEIVTAITGVVIQSKMIVLAAATTGLFSMATYETLKWWAVKTKRMSIYHMLAVKHCSALGDVGDSDNGDLTRTTFVNNNEDDNDITEEK